MNKRDIVRSTVAERARTLALLNPLPVERFDTPTALEGWRIREVVAHLITTDRGSVTGSIAVVVFRSTDRLERWNDRQVKAWADRPVRELLLALDRWGRRFATYARAIPVPAYRLRLRTMYGRGPAGLLIWARPFDEWVHRQDIRRALDLPDEEVDLETVAEFVLTAISVNTLPQLEGASGRVALSLTDVALPEWSYDLAARTGGPGSAEGADARIMASAGPFVMASAHRESFAELEARGADKLEENEDLARTFLSKVRII